MATLSRREALTLFGGATVSTLLSPSTSFAQEVKLKDADIEDSHADITALQAEYGSALNATITKVSKTLQNRITGESVRFFDLDNGKQVWLYRGEVNSYVPFAHRHEQAEIYRVVKGQVDVCIDGVWKTAKAGETLVIPSMAMHEAQNPYTEAVEILVDFDPMDEEVKAMGKVYWLACELGWTKKNGAPQMSKLIPELKGIGSKSYPEHIPMFLVDIALG